MTPDLVVLVQAAAAALDLGPYVPRVLSFIGLGLLGTVVWFLKRLIAGVDEVGQSVNAMKVDVQKVSHELFGATGTNGMRSDLKRARRSLARHERVLIELAVRNEIEIPDDEEDDQS